MAGAVYGARPIKRQRATRAELDARRDGLFAVLSEHRPMTVRQVFYQATVRDLVDKSEAGYRKVQTDLVEMRRSGRVPYGWITDNTRWRRQPVSYDGPEEAVEATSRFYRKALWAETEVTAEIWLEKDALSGVVWPVTAEFDVPLMVTRGYASLSFLHQAAEDIEADGRPAFIYHLGDFDPSGVDAGRKIEWTLREMAPDAEIVFERLAVTPDQIAAWALPTRPTKRSDSRAAGFGAVSVELDAIEPGRLRGLVRDAIERHLPPDQFAVLKAAEASERAALRGLAGMVDGGPS